MSGAGRSRGRRSPKATALIAVLAGASAVLVSTAQPWVTGQVDDAVLGASQISATGSTLAASSVVLALVAAAGVVAAAIGGRLARVASAIAVLLAGVFVLVLVLAVVRDPGAAVGEVAAAATGRTGAIPALGATVTFWPWVALLGSVLVGAGGLIALRAGPDWARTPRFDREPDGRAAPGTPGKTADPADPSDPASRLVPPGVQPVTDWDRLSRDQDPTE